MRLYVCCAGSLSQHVNVKTLFKYLKRHNRRDKKPEWWVELQQRVFPLLKTPCELHTLQLWGYAILMKLVVKLGGVAWRCLIVIHCENCCGFTHTSYCLHIKFQTLLQVFFWHVNFIWKRHIFKWWIQSAHYDSTVPVCSESLNIIFTQYKRWLMCVCGQYTWCMHWS